MHIHLEVVNGIQIADKAAYHVEGIIVINAQTLYIYGANFPTLTLHNFEQLPNEKYVNPKFLFKNAGRNC